MTTHENAESDYMKGWHIGAMPAEAGAGLVEHYKPKGMWTDEMQRGYEAGRNCAEIAAQVEKERRETWCSTCRGRGWVWDAPSDPRTINCPTCHGTRRGP